jgi:hypothetical protein
MAQLLPFLILNKSPETYFSIQHHVDTSFEHRLSFLAMAMLTLLPL